MNVVRFWFLLTMRPQSYDLSFRLFGFPTTIQAFFWLIALLITAVHIGGINNNMPFWIALLVVGTAAVLLSILVYELGHALTFRYVFRTPCSIVLHGFGGMTIPEYHRRGSGVVGTVAQCFLAFLGPLAGFILGGIALILFEYVPVNQENVGQITLLLLFFLQWTGWISIVWGIFNLLPIYPMDGGHIAREMFLYFFPWRGIEFSLILSMMFAIFLIVVALRFEEIFIAFIFAFFAYQNYQEWTFRSFRR